MFGKILEFLSDDTCVSCGKYLNDFGAVCRDCEEKMTLSKNYVIVADTMAVFSYREIPTKSAVLLAKRKFSNRVFDFMAEKMSEVFWDNYENLALFGKMRKPLLTSVPLSYISRARRGYNQSEILAKKISKITNIKFKRLLKRGVLSFLHKKQSLIKDKEMRFKNVRGQIFARRGIEDIVRDRTIIVVDDVMTTGATFQECKRVLINAGARNCIGLFFAH